MNNWRLLFQSRAVLWAPLSDRANNTRSLAESGCEISHPPKTELWPLIDSSPLIISNKARRIDIVKGRDETRRGGRDKSNGVKIARGSRHVVVMLFKDL